MKSLSCSVHRAFEQSVVLLVAPSSVRQRKNVNTFFQRRAIDTQTVVTQENLGKKRAWRRYEGTLVNNMLFIVVFSMQPDR